MLGQTIETTDSKGHRLVISSPLSLDELHSLPPHEFIQAFRDERERQGELTRTTPEDMTIQTAIHCIKILAGAVVDGLKSVGDKFRGVEDEDVV